VVSETWDTLERETSPFDWSFYRLRAWGNQCVDLVRKRTLFDWLFRSLATAASIWPACRYALNAHPSIDKDLDRSPWHCSLERDTHPWIAVHRIAAHPSITVGESTPSDWLGSPCTGDRFRERHALRSPCVETRPLIAVHRIVRRADTNFDCRWSPCRDPLIAEHTLESPCTTHPSID